MELRVSSYGSRADLEAYCDRLDPEQKQGLEIVGTKEELALFQLSQETTVHGIPCRITDADLQSPSAPAPKRIKGSGYGVNGLLTKLPE